MSVAIAILLTLATAGAQLLGNTEMQTQKSGTELLTSLIEDARNTALTSRRHVILAIAEPGDLVNNDGRCRLGIFKVDSWPESIDEPIFQAIQKGRWRALEQGLTISGGNLDGHDNPLEAPELALEFGTKSKPLSAKFHAIAFNPHGSIIHPASTNPIVVRIAAGNYQNGKAIPRRRDNNGTLVENKIKVGRVSARPYRMEK
jgi:hypothetical protein